MRILFSTLLLLCTTTALSQSTENKLLFATPEDTVSKSGSIKTLRQKAVLVFAYRTYTSWNYTKPYSIIALMNDSSIMSFEFSLPNSLTRQNENIDTLKNKLKLLYTYDLFSMTKTDDWMQTCDNSAPSCGDCEEYDFVIMTKDKVKRLYFYIPGLYVDYCKSVQENKRIIEFIKQLWN